MSNPAQKRSPRTSSGRPSSTTRRPDADRRPSSTARRPDADRRPSSTTRRPDADRRPSSTTRRPDADRRPSSTTRRPDADRRPSSTTRRPDADRRPSSTARRPDADRRPSSTARRFDSERPLLYTKKNDKKPSSDRPPQELYAWGRHVVESFLNHLAQKESDTFNSSLYKLHIIVDKSGKAPAQLKTAVDQAQFLGIKIFTHASAEEDWPLSGNQELNHQRICLTIPEYPTKNVVDAVNTVKQAAEKSEHGCVGIVLDQIQDPRNFGAILRSAAYFGVKFVVFGTDRQASITSLVLKTSAGGAFSIDLIPVTNINRAIEQLKEAGCWVIGTSLEEGKTSPLSKLPKDRTWVAVMGNEEKGLRSEVAKNCDYLVKIEGKPQGVDSLNVSVATGIFLHSLAQ